MRPAMPARQNVNRVGAVPGPAEASEFSEPPPPSPRAVVFQYIGPTALSVIGPLSGRRYDFLRPGAVVEVDPRDRASLADIPKLQQIRSS